MRYTRIVGRAAAFSATAVRNIAADQRPDRKQVLRLVVVRPDLVGEWIPDLNDVDVGSVAATSELAASWRCSSCHHQWACEIRARALGDSGCPECARRATSGISALTDDRCLEETHPQLLEQWDTERNGALRPADVHDMNTRLVWWKSADRRESFLRPVYSFVHNQRSLREVYADVATQRHDALKALAPLCGYELPSGAIDHTVSAFKDDAVAGGRGGNASLSRSSPGHFTQEELYGFDVLWGKQRNERLARAHARTAGLTEAEEAVGALVRAKMEPPKSFKLANDLGDAYVFPPAIPVLATVDVHARLMVEAAVEAEAEAEETPAKRRLLPSFVLDREASHEYFSLSDTLRERLAARSASARTVRQDKRRPTRPMPAAPTPEELLYAEETKAQQEGDLEGQDGEAAIARQFRSRTFRKRSGFQFRQTLSTPDELDNSLGSKSLSASVDLEDSGPADVPVPEPEIPAAPRVVARRRAAPSA